MKSRTEPNLAALLQDYFTNRLINQQNVSAHTIAAYRDTIKILLRFFQQTKHISPTALNLRDLDTPSILEFLDHLETERHNSIRTRNARLVVIRSFLQYAAAKAPSQLPSVQRVLAIPIKRYRRPMLGHLSRAEMEAIIGAPSSSTWSGRRDRVLFAVMYNTGARVSEITDLKRENITLGKVSTVTISGKGRKQRIVPIWRETADALRAWLDEIERSKSTPLFPNNMGHQLSRSGIEHRLKGAINEAKGSCPSLFGKRISPHTIRHTTAMHLLQSGVDITVISLWLGHESCETTHQYVEANLAMKEKALANVKEIPIGKIRRHSPDKIIRFLETL